MKRKTALLLGIVLLMGVTTIAASLTATKEVNNYLYMDTVDIYLEEYMKTEDGEMVLFEGPENVTPGDSISFIAQVENRGIDAYIRVSVDIDAYNDLLDLSHLKLKHKDQWVYKDGYLYYLDVLHENETVDVFESIDIPETWTNDTKNTDVQIEVVVDAVQMRNFNPDYDAENPWGDTVVEKTVRSRESR